MYWMPGAGQDHYRIGISVRKALGGAVQRNRARRVVREIMRRVAPSPPPGADAVIYVKKDFLTSVFGDAEQEMKNTLEAAHVWNKN
jgi:ribonuclease P protein component